MIITDPIQRRVLAKRKWISPISGLERIEAARMFSRILPEVGGSRSWRKGKFKKYFEEGLCALFAYGLSQQASEWRWEYSFGESANQESDCAVRCWLPAEGNRKEG